MKSCCRFIILNISPSPTAKALSKEWLLSRDSVTFTIITSRIKRIQYGNLSNCKALGQGLHELKIDYGPGYRLYFANQGDKVILILTAGNKKTQDADIKKAQEWLKTI